jgi:LuxR family maltose regulon positive regulatory protein
VALDYIDQILAAFPDFGFTIDDHGFESRLPTPKSKNQKLAEPLTNRELDVLELLARRLSNQEIAQQLVISSETVRKHNVSIYHKLGVKSRREAVAKAKAMGILPDS